MKKLLIVLFALPLMVTAQVEKIDIMQGQIFTYNDAGGSEGAYPLDTAEYQSFIDRFSDSTDLVSINITSPLKRVMKFYDISGGIPKSFIELDYIDMSSEDKSVLDTFIITLYINSL